jgi:cell division protein FtsB
MDFRIKQFPRFRALPTPEDGLRLVAERAPQAEAFAASWIERARPGLAKIYLLRRKLATAGVGIVAVFLFVHVLFGANGMVVYKQKKAEYESLQKKIVIEQKENDLYTKQIQALKTDEKAIEKEAREQLRYARPGEYVYVPAPAAHAAPPATHSAKK